MPARSALSISGSSSEPSSRYLASRSSSVSAAASTSFSRYSFTRSASVGRDVGLGRPCRRRRRSPSCVTRSTKPRNPPSSPTGRCTGDEPALEAAPQRLQRAEEVGALAVEPVDDDGARQVELGGELPDLLGLHLHAGHRVDDDHRRLDHPQAGPRVRDEVAVAGGVDQVDAVALPVAVGDRGVDRDLALDLVGIEVGGGACRRRLGRGGSPRRRRTASPRRATSCPRRRDRRRRRCGSSRFRSPLQPGLLERRCGGGMLPPNGEAG